MKILSLGWGVQSFTIAAMVAFGELEPINYAIHADTTHEASWTYDFAEEYTEWLVSCGIQVRTIQPKNANDNRRVEIPAYTFGKNGKGQTRRQCTGAWKIEPIRRELQKIRNGDPIEMWLGISMDEYQRMRLSDVKYITHKYPLIEKKMTRANCVDWLTTHNLEIPNRSACVFCPYHNTQEWREIMNSQENRNRAINYDEFIRKMRPPHDLFIHPSRKPISEVDLRTETEKGQYSLWNDECTGICGV